MSYSNDIIKKWRKERCWDREHRRRVARIEQRGLPCRLTVIEDDGEGRITVKLEPGPGWVHLHRPPREQQIPYHVSLCYTWDIQNEANMRQVSALKRRWCGRYDRLPVRKVSNNAVALLEENHPLITDPSFRVLHNLGWHSCPSVSM